jgi:hypothetical protein
MRESQQLSVNPAILKNLAAAVQKAGVRIWQGARAAGTYLQAKGWAVLALC